MKTETKILLLLTVLGFAGLKGIAQANGKQKSRQGNSQSANRSSNTASSGRVGSQTQWRGQDSLAMIKSPKTQVNKMEDESKERTKQNGNNQKGRKKQG